MKNSMRNKIPYHIADKGKFMNILIVTQYYYPEQFQINEIAPELKRRGHDVTVLTGLPNYPQGEIYDGYQNIREETIDGIKIIRVPIHPRKHGPVHLVWNYLSYVMKGNRAARKLPAGFDIILSYQLSPVTSLYPALTYKKKHGTPILNYCLDIWPESAQAHVKTDKGLLYKYIHSVSKRLYQQCDHIAVTSRPFIDYLSAKNGIATEKMSYIPQHADDSYLSLDLHSRGNGIADFMYAGNLGQGQWVDVIIKAAREIKSENFRIHIVGDGSVRADLEKLAKDLLVEDKVIFYGNQKRTDMPEFYRKADALLITLRGNNFVGCTMPGKLQAYMACGKPIFGAINGAANETITHAECGKCVAAGDYKGLAAIMKDYIDHPEQYDRCGENARTYFKEHFTLDIFMERLEKQMRDMVQ